MTKFDVDIMDLFVDKAVKRAEDSISINEIQALLPDCKRKSQPSVYRHVRCLVQKGFLTEGLRVGGAATYYLSKAGVNYCESYHSDTIGREDLDVTYK